MRKFLLVLLVLVFTLMLAQVVLAKGPADMISVRGPGLAEEFRTTRADLVLDLSLGYFESTCREAIGDIALLGEGYNVIRYYQTSDGNFHSHDRFIYYPRDSQQSVVSLVDYTNTSPGHREQWTCASEQGEAAFRRLLAEAETQPYLMLAQTDGLLRIADPESLAQVAEIDLSAAYPSHIRSTAGGQALHYQSADGAEIQQFMLNLESGVQCVQAANAGDEDVAQQMIDSFDGRWHAVITSLSNRTVIDLEHMSMGTANSHTLRNESPVAYSGAWDTNGIRFYLTDSTSIYRFEPYSEGRMRENALLLPDAAPAGAPLEIAGVVNDTAYLYYLRDTDTTAGGQDELSGGIFVVNALTGAQIDHLQPELLFVRVLLANNGLYAVQSQANATTQLYSIDRTDGAIVAEESLQGSISDAAYGTLNPAVLGNVASPVSLANCPDDSSPFVHIQDALATFPQN